MSKRTTVGLMLASMAGIVLGVIPSSANALSAVAPRAVATSVAVGTVTRNGTPVAGANVHFEVWPNQTALAKLPTGARFSPRTVADIRTDSRGGFALNVDWASLPATYRNGSGVANFQLIVNDATGRAVWGLPATDSRSAAKQGGAAPLLATSGTNPDTLNIDLGRGLITSALASRSITVDRSGKQVASPGTKSITVLKRPTGTVTSNSFCSDPRGYYTAGSYHYGIDESFARVFAWKYASATFRQTTGASHGLGFGISFDGGKNWGGANGGVNMDETTSNSAAKYGQVDVWMHNRINYRDFYFYCPSQYPSRWAERLPVSTYALLSSTSYAGHDYYAYCNVYYPGDNLTKSSGVNLTYSGGVSLLGIYVHAQSGWNSSTDETFVVQQRSRYCGNQPTGPVSSQSVDVGAA